MAVNVTLERDEFGETDYLNVFRGQVGQIFIVVKVPKRTPKPLPDTIKFCYPEEKEEA